MTTLTQGAHPQLEARQFIQQAAAIAGGCFPAFHDQFLAHGRISKSVPPAAKSTTL